MATRELCFLFERDKSLTFVLVFVRNEEDPTNREWFVFIWLLYMVVMVSSSVTWLWYNASAASAEKSPTNM